MSRAANAIPARPDTRPDTWIWPEERWRPIAEKIRAGRSLKRAAWPNDARCAVALSFDSDHETQRACPGRSDPFGPCAGGITA